MENLDAKLTDFDHLLRTTIEEMKAERADLSYLHFLQDSIGKLSNAIIELGAFSYQKVAEAPKTIDVLPYYFLNFLWNDQAKSFLVLCRDVLFEQQKAQILLLEDKVTEETIPKLRIASQQAIENAVGDLSGYFEQGIRQIKAGKKGGLKEVENWALLDNPQPVYQTQINALVIQCQDLLTQNKVLTEVAGHFTAIQNAIAETVNICERDIELIKDKAEETIEFVEKQDIQQVGKIATHLKTLEDQISISDEVHQFPNRLEAFLHLIAEQTDIAVNTKGGVIQVRTINFQKNTRQWLSAEVLPLLYELWELAEKVVREKKMSLVNIHNRAILLSNEIKEKGVSELAEEDLHQPLTTFLKIAQKTEKEFQGITALLYERLATFFKVSEIYELEKPFLAIPFQSTLNQYRKLPDTPLLGTIRNWWKRQVAALSTLRNSVAAEETLSVSEKIVRVIENRTIHTDNAQYSGIFLTKGYIGEAFRVGRKTELTHLGKLVRQWKKGFRGAVVLSGKRLSGKTLFGEYAANHFFRGNYIQLSPNMTINLNGRKFTPTFDLAAALEFIRKNTFDSKSLVWVDDLELWSDANITLSQNVRTFAKFIDKQANKLFFMVAMNPWTKAHLDKIHDLNQVFQAEINLDAMNLEEVHEAILIRHGATHKKLVDKKGVKIRPEQLKKLTTKIYSHTAGNIGEALNEWAYFIESVDDEKVRYDRKYSYILPDFVNPDAAILLSALMRERRANEYQLRQLFGTPFKEKYSNVLQRLISVGILKRDVDGWLEINEVVVNEVGNLLENKHYLLVAKK